MISPTSTPEVCLDKVHFESSSSLKKIIYHQLLTYWMLPNEDKVPIHKHLNY